MGIFDISASKVGIFDILPKVFATLYASSTTNSTQMGFPWGSPMCQMFSTILLYILQPSQQQPMDMLTNAIAPWHAHACLVGLGWHGPMACPWLDEWMIRLAL